MTIEPIKLSDINKISYLHKKNLLSPSSKIGENYLKSLYNLLLSHPKVHSCLLIRVKGEIAGSITATVDLHKTNNILQKLNSPKTIFQITTALLLRRVSFAELVQRFRFEKSILKQFPMAYPTIITIFVDQRFQRKGIGTKLIKAILKQFKDRGIRKVYVDTLIDNKKAIVFYQTLGFKHKKTLIDSEILEIQLS